MSDNQPHKNQPAILLATLGTEPQVVTAALDLLRRQGERFAEARVFHTTAPGSQIEKALLRLQQAFAEPPYNELIPLKLLAISDRQGRPLVDVQTPGLLHDIGKLEQRARTDPCSPAPGMQGEPMPVHATWSMYFIVEKH